MTYIQLIQQCTYAGCKQSGVAESIGIITILAAIKFIDRWFYTPTLFSPLGDYSCTGYYHRSVKVTAIVTVTDRWK